MNTDAQGRCVLLTGLPRGGTTVACEMLNRLPDVRALDEPMDVIATIRRADTGAGGLDGALVHAEIQSFAEEQRRSILEHGLARTKHVDGRVLGAKVADRREEDGRGQRVRLTELGDIAVEAPSTPGFTLVIKHPVAFTAMLPTLQERFEVFAIVRNPLAVLASWETVPMAVREGQLGLPAAVAPTIARRLDAIEDRLDRQLALLDWFYDCYSALPPQRIVRYEDIVAGGGAALAPIAASATVLHATLASRNAATVYDRAHMRHMGQLLLERDGAHRRFYTPVEVGELMSAAGVL